MDLHVEKGGIRRLEGALEQELLKDIRELAELCDTHEGIRLKLNWDMLERRPEGEANDFIYVENGRLLGLLSLYCFNPNEAEVGGMVHPEYRRQGIFSRLLEAAAEEARNRRIPKLLFVCPSGSAGAKVFVERIAAPYSFSEYGMRLADEAFAEAKAAAAGGAAAGAGAGGAAAGAGAGDAAAAGAAAGDGAGDTAAGAGLPPVMLRRAGQEDSLLITSLDARGFDMTEEDSEQLTKMVLENPEENWPYIAVNSADAPIGKITVHAREGNAHFFGFSVLPEYRGAGLGRAILTEGIRLMTAPAYDFQSMSLEVACDNRNALRLYQSCGFRETYVNDYYEWKL